MIEPITSGTTGNPWEPYAEYEAQLAKSQSNPEIDDDDAEEVVASYWYQSSIKSSQTTLLPSTEDTQTNKIQAHSVKSDQSRFQKIRSWLWGVFGGDTTQEVTANIAQQEVSSIDKHASAALGSPKLQSPELMSNERLSKAIADLNKDLLHRLKDTAEFETELRKSNSKAMDRLILLHIVSKSLDQKKLKEEAGFEAHEHILNLQKVNKDLHQKHYRLLDDINATAKTNSTLHWINVGTTAGIVGTMAVGFATGGTSVAFAIAMPALNILKGGLSGAEGVLKYKNDLRIGEMTHLNHEVKINRNNLNDNANTKLPTLGEEMSHLLKAIRHHLENYSKEARVNSQS